MPAHVESVTWIVGRTDLFASSFLLLALWLDRHARRRDRSWSGVLVPLALALALASKESAALGVGVIAIAEIIEGRRPSLGVRLRWLMPYAGVTVIYLIGHLLVVPTMGGDQGRGRLRGTARLSSLRGRGVGARTRSPEDSRSGR